MSFPFGLSIVELNSGYRFRIQRDCIEIAVNDDYYYYRQSTRYERDDFRSRFSQRSEKNKNYTVVIVHTRMVNVIVPHANRPVPTLRYSRACDYYFLFTYTEIYLFIRERPPPGRWRSSREGRLISCKRVCSMCNVSRLYGMHIIYACICIHIRKMYYTQHVCALAMKTGCERP